jgi:outer membrane immunogenic protein
MKKFVLAGLALGALVASGSAQAADLPLKAAPAAVPAPGFDWSGIYIGGHIGGGWATNDLSDPGLSGLFAITGLNIPVVQTVDSSGFLGGVQAGWNYQVGRLVLGTEVDFSWADVNGTNTATFGIVGAGPGGPVFNRALTANTDWTATSTVRLGYAHDRWMFYSKAGAAFAHTKYASNWTASAGGASAAVFSGTGAQTAVGWTVGFGAEWAFWNNWSAKLEYNFMDFGSKTATINGVIGPGVINAPASFGLVNEQTISEVKFGVNYKIMPLIW